GFSVALNGLSSSGTGNSVVDSSAAGAMTLTVGGTDLSSSFGGVIKNSSGSLALTKAGTGNLTLSGNNTYSGATTIQGGDFALKSGTLSNNIANSSTIDVQAN